MSSTTRISSMTATVHVASLRSHHISFDYLYLLLTSLFEPAAAMKCRIRYFAEDDPEMTTESLQSTNGCMTSLTYENIIQGELLAFSLHWDTVCAPAIQKFCNLPQCRKILTYCVENNVRVRRSKLNEAQLEEELMDEGAELRIGVESILRILSFCQHGDVTDLHLDPNSSMGDPGVVTQIRHQIFRALCNFLLRHLFFRFQADEKPKRLPKGKSCFLIFYISEKSKKEVRQGSMGSWDLDSPLAVPMADPETHIFKKTEDGVLHDVINSYGYRSGGDQATVSLLLKDLSQLHVAFPECELEPPIPPEIDPMFGFTLSIVDAIKLHHLIPCASLQDICVQIRLGASSHWDHSPLAVAHYGDVLTVLYEILYSFQKQLNIQSLSLLVYKQKDRRLRRMASDEMKRLQDVTLLAKKQQKVERGTNRRMYGEQSDEDDEQEPRMVDLIEDRFSEVPLAIEILSPTLPNVAALPEKLLYLCEEIMTATYYQSRYKAVPGSLTGRTDGRKWDCAGVLEKVVCPQSILIDPFSDENGILVMMDEGGEEPAVSNDVKLSLRSDFSSLMWGQTLAEHWQAFGLATADDMQQFCDDEDVEVNKRKESVFEVPQLMHATGEDVLLLCSHVATCASIYALPISLIQAYLLLTQEELFIAMHVTRTDANKKDLFDSMISLIQYTLYLSAHSDENHEGTNWSPPFTGNFGSSTQQQVNSSSMNVEQGKNEKTGGGPEIKNNKGAAVPTYNALSSTAKVKKLDLDGIQHCTSMFVPSKHRPGSSNVTSDTESLHEGDGGRFCVPNGVHKNEMNNEDDVEVLLLQDGELTLDILQQACERWFTVARYAIVSRHSSFISNDAVASAALDFLLLCSTTFFSPLEGYYVFGEALIQDDVLKQTIIEWDAQLKATDRVLKARCGDFGVAKTGSTIQSAIRDLFSLFSPLPPTTTSG